MKRSNGNKYTQTSGGEYGVKFKHKYMNVFPWRNSKLLESTPDGEKYQTS